MEDNQASGSPSIHFELDPTSLDLVATTTDAISDLSLDRIRKEIESAGFGNCLLKEKQMLGLVKIAQHKPADRIPVGFAAHGKMELSIDSDGLAARMKVSPAQGGDRVTLEEAMEALREEDLENSVDTQRLQTIVRNADDNWHVIATGQAPEDGADAFFQPLVAEMVDRRPRIDDSERADFRDLGGVVTVQAGDRLLQRHPPTVGTTGTDVRGLPIPAKPGKDRQFKAGMKGVEVDESDPDILRASIDGQPIWKDDNVMVSPVLDLDAVDLSTGNIDFNGTVRVRGDIEHGMSVRARDDIQVGGMVDGAELVAGGDIVIKGGVIGQRRAGSQGTFNARIQCEGAVEARFMEHVQVRCGTEAMIRDLAAHCDMEVGERLVVGAKGTRKGHILGGRYEAFELIRAVQLGGRSGAETIVRVGDAVRLKRRIRQIEARLNKSSLGPEELELLHERQAALNDLSRRLQEDCRIIARESVFTRVCMQIGTATQQFTRDAAAGTYRRRQDRIEIDPNA